MKVLLTKKQFREDLADYHWARDAVWTEDLSVREVYDFLLSSSPSESPLRSDHASFKAEIRDFPDSLEPRGRVTQWTMNPTDGRTGKWLRILWWMGRRKRHEDAQTEK